MVGVIFRHTLRHSWLQALYWGLGLGLMALLVVLVLPLMDYNKMAELIQNLPPFVRAAVGVGDDLEYAFSTEGMIAVGFFGKLALIFAVYPAVVGMRVIANEEDAGILDVVLTLPVRRWQVLLERFLAYLATLLIICGLVFLGLWAGAQLAGQALDLGKLAVSALNLLPTLTLVLAFTVFAGALIGRRTVALTVVTLFVVGSFALETVGGMAKGTAAEGLRSLSFFAYFDALGVMRSGLAAANVVVLVGAAAALLAGSVWAFQRRDVGV